MTPARAKKLILAALNETASDCSDQEFSDLLSELIDELEIRIDAARPLALELEEDADEVGGEA